jgi:hypothetical protein
VLVSVGEEKRMQIRLLLQRLGKSNPVVLYSIGVPAVLVVLITEYMETFSGVHEMWPTYRGADKSLARSGRKRLTGQDRWTNEKT